MKILHGNWNVWLRKIDCIWNDRYDLEPKCCAVTKEAQNAVVVAAAFRLICIASWQTKRNFISFKTWLNVMRNNLKILKSWIENQSCVLRWTTGKKNIRDFISPYAVQCQHIYRVMVYKCTIKRKVWSHMRRVKDK